MRSGFYLTLVFILVTSRANETKFASNEFSTSLEERDQGSDNKVLDEVIVDLKSKLYPQTSDRFIYRSDFGNEVANSHVHSSQINSTSLGKYFEIVNKTNIALLSLPSLSEISNRRSICSDVKMCDRKLENSQICLLNINLILYMSSRQIKLVNIGVILNDLTDDYLYFEKSSYEFNVDPTASFEIGSVKAFTTKNSDLIKYYVNFKEVNYRDELVSILNVEEITGRLVLNRTKLAGGFYRRRIEFFVGAVVQCSYGQRMLQNQTRVRLNIIDSNQTPPILNITHLLESKTLKLGPKCLKLNQSDLRVGEANSSPEIALAQIQIDNLVDYDLEYSELSIVIDSIEPKIDLNLELRHLIDNIYVIYLQKPANQIESRFLNDLYRVNLKFTYSDSQTVWSDIYLCIHSLNTNNFADELNLLQFDSNLVRMDSSQSFLDIKARKIGPFKSRIRYFLHSADSASISNFELSPIGNDVIRFSLRPEIKQDQAYIREVVLVAYDEMRFPDFRTQYEAMRRLAYANNNRLMHFATRIRIVFDSEVHVSDQSVERIDEIYKFSVSFANMANNSIIGYLPSVYELYSNEAVPITQTEYKIISSNVHSSCFHVTKYDGILYYIEPTPKKCLSSHYPVKLHIELVPGRRTHILIYDRPSTPIKTVNVALEQNKLVPTSLNFEINLNFQGNLDYNLEENLPLINFVPPDMKPDLRVKFELKSKTEIFVLDSKRSRLYLKKSSIVHQNRIQNAFLEDNKCFELDISSSIYSYKNSTHRNLILSSQALTSFNICFYIGRDSNQSSMFLIPIEQNELASFETLVKSRLLSSYVPLVWYFTLAVFAFIFTVLVLFLVYNACTGQGTKTKNVTPRVDRRPFTNYENLDTKFSNTSKYSSTSSSSYYEDGSNSFDRQNALKIRSDHPSIKTGESFGDDLNRISSENYGFLLLTNDDRQVPSKLDILLNKKPLSTRIVNEMVSPSKGNEEAEMLSGDHGVYCLATATSFTSNVSSVSNSECVDAEMNGYSNLNTSSAFNPVQKLNANNTHLSLFELTPTSHRFSHMERQNCLRLGINDNFDYTEIKHVFNGECII